MTPHHRILVRNSVKHFDVSREHSSEICGTWGWAPSGQEVPSRGVGQEVAMRAVLLGIASLLLVFSAGCDDRALPSSSGPTDSSLPGLLIVRDGGGCCPMSFYATGCTHMDQGRRFTAMEELGVVEGRMREVWDEESAPGCFQALEDARTRLLGTFDPPIPEDPRLCVFTESIAGQPGGPPVLGLTRIVFLPGSPWVRWGQDMGFRSSMFDPGNAHFQHLGRILFHEGTHAAFPFWDEAAVAEWESLCNVDPQ